MSYKWCICILIFHLLLLAISSVTAIEKRGDEIVVDPTGKGNFKTIQAAINSVPPNNKKLIIILIKAGFYREQVFIPQEKQFIYLKGEGRDKTFVSWDGSPNLFAATFATEADNTLAKDITFINSHNYPTEIETSRNPTAQAVAGRVQGNNSAFYKCGFYSLQDTLWDIGGRHYYRLCAFKGGIDFIFGGGQTIFENCVISVASLNGTNGYITAQGRDKPEDTNGFVFKECNIDGKGKAFLGRPWRPYARVLFHNTKMSDIVLPQGWEAGPTDQQRVTFAEHNCSGAGARTDGRVKWEKKLSEEEVKRLTSISFIDNEGWVKKALAILVPK